MFAGLTVSLGTRWEWCRLLHIVGSLLLLLGRPFLLGSVWFEDHPKMRTTIVASFEQIGS